MCKKLDTFGFPFSLRPRMPAVLLMLSFKDSFTPTCRSITVTAPPQRTVSLKKWYDQVFILIAIMKKTYGHSLFHHYSLSTKTRMDDLYGPTLVSYHKEQLWSVNRSIVSVGGNGDTKDEVNIRLPNVLNKHVKRRGFMKTIRKTNICPRPERRRREGMYKGIASQCVLFQRNR